MTIRRPVEGANAVLCGASTAWPNGSPPDRTPNMLTRGWLRSALVRCVGRDSASWTLVLLTLGSGYQCFIVKN